MGKFSLSSLFGRSSGSARSPNGGHPAPHQPSQSPEADGKGSDQGVAGPPEDGIHVSVQGVLHLQGDSATLALNGGARHQVLMHNAGSGITVSVTSWPHPGAQELRYAKEFALVQAGAAQAMFSATVAAWHRTLWTAPEVSGAGLVSRSAQPGSRRSALLLVAGGALAAVVLMTGAGLLMSPPSAAPAPSPLAAAPDAAAALAPAQMPATQPAAGQISQAALAEAQSRLQQARLPQAELSRVNSSAHRIQVREGSAALAAFSDPNCPACQELEREATALKAGQGFAVIPVGFQPGSRVLAARVLCAKDPVKAWADAIRGVAPAEQACEAGLRKIDENNNLFASIGASATPTLVAANGQLAQGAATGAQLQLFASTYAK
jgi:protein-disulfide isomerase